MDLKELFGGEYVIKVTFRGCLTVHHLRQATAEEDLEYRRRSAKMNFKGRRLETSDSALEAPIWLYNKLITKVFIQNGTPELEEVPFDLLKDQNQLKLQVINAMLGDISRDEDAELKN